MQSVFHGDVHEMYDLKGSTVGRCATEAEKARGPAHTVLKDMDLTRKIRLGPGRREAFLRQVALDAAFLERMGIMDYSRLLGIHVRSRGAGAAATAAGAVAGAAAAEEAAAATEAAAVAAGATTATAATVAAASTSPLARRASASDSDGDEAGGVGSDDADADAGGEAAGGSGSGSGSGSGGSDTDKPRSPLGIRGVGRPGGGGGGGGNGGAAAARRSLASQRAHEEHEAQRARRELQQHAADVMAAAGAGLGARAAALDDLASAHGLGLPIRALASVAAGAAGGGGGGGGGTTPGVVNGVEPPGPRAETEGGVQGMDLEGNPTDEVYFMGIIDVLQQYDLRKMGETVFKSLLHPATAAGISAVPPATYAARFVSFLAEHTE